MTNDSTNPTGRQGGLKPAPTPSALTPASTPLTPAPARRLVQPDDEYNRALVSAVHPPDWVNPRPAGRYNLVVIGAGTAGLVTAAGAAGLGAKVALVERHLLGGDCLNYGCVPSKALLRSARAAHDVRTASAYGVDVAGPIEPDFGRAMARLRRLRAGIAPHDSVFVRTVFKAVEGMEFYKVIGEPIALIECTLPVNTPEARVAWMGWKVPLRQNVYSLTYRTKDASGKPAVIVDGLSDPPTFDLSRELSDREVKAFNPWNLLRATPAGVDDGWDPAQARGRYGSLALEDQVFRMTMTNGTPSIRTGGSGADIEVKVSPVRARGVPITWKTSSPLVTLSGTTGDRITVTGNNTTDRAEYIQVTATAPNGFYATAHVFVGPEYTVPPTFSRRPEVKAPSGGSAVVDYALDMHTKVRHDESDVTWSLCEEPSCASPRVIAVSRDRSPSSRVRLMPGFVGKYLRAGVKPKHDISEAGDEVFGVSARPVGPGDVNAATVALEPRSFVETPTTAAPGTWIVQGAWKVAADEQYVGGYGIHGTSADASLIYHHDRPVDRMSIRVVVTPDKATGQSFAVPGSPDDRHAALNGDIYIKYDPRTRTGYSLRGWRTTESATKVMFQFFRHVSGVASPLDGQQVLTGVLKPNATLIVSVDGTEITAEGRNEADDETLSLRATIEPNAFGGAGVRWPGSAGVNSRNIFSVVEISYPEEGGSGK